MIEVCCGELARYLGGPLFTRIESPARMGKEEKGKGREGLHEGNCVWKEERDNGFRRRVAERNAPKTKADSSRKSKDEPSSEKPVWRGSVD